MEDETDQVEEKSNSNQFPLNPKNTQTTPFEPNSEDNRRHSQLACFELDFSNTNIPEVIEEDDEDEKEEMPPKKREKSVSFGNSIKIPEEDENELFSNLNTIRNSLKHSSSGKQSVYYQSNPNTDSEDDDFVEIVAEVEDTQNENGQSDNKFSSMSVPLDEIALYHLKRVSEGSNHGHKGFRYEAVKEHTAAKMKNGKVVKDAETLISIKKIPSRLSAFKSNTKAKDSEDRQCSVKMGSKKSKYAKIPKDVSGIKLPDGKKIMATPTPLKSKPPRRIPKDSLEKGHFCTRHLSSRKKDAAYKEADFDLNFNRIGINDQDYHKTLIDNIVKVEEEEEADNHLFRVVTMSPMFKVKYGCSKAITPVKSLDKANIYEGRDCKEYDKFIFESDDYATMRYHPEIVERIENMSKRKDKVWDKE